MDGNTASDDPTMEGMKQAGKMKLTKFAQRRQECQPGHLLRATLQYHNTHLDPLANSPISDTTSTILCKWQKSLGIDCEQRPCRPENERIGEKTVG
jgi:hypothetical protein